MTMNETTTPGALAPGVAVPSRAADSAAHAAAGGHDQADRAESLSPVPLGRRQQAWARLMREYPHRFDIALALLILVATVGALISAHRMGDDPTPPSWVWLASVIACGALPFRRAYPWPVLVVTAAGYLVVQSFSHDVPPLIFAVVTALVTITLAGQRWAAIVAAVVITGFALLIGTLRDAEYWSHPRPLAVAALSALAIALADAVRNRRAYVAAVEERARRAEESREQEARRRVGDERLRIARELHDVLAHHIAVINVQAGVAGHLLERQPAQAREALDHVRAAARSVLSEMQAVVTVLREPGESPDAADIPIEPVPGMSQIGALIDGFRGVGLTVETVVSGRPHALPPAVDLVAYRAVQESLTNVGKHAMNAAVTVQLDYRPDSLTVTVANAGTGQASRAAGHAMGSTAGFGLIGMRERVHSVGGQLRAGPTADGGFLVTITLPLDSVR
jgi:signal transduction histidine kinase